MPSRTGKKEETTPATTTTTKVINYEEVEGEEEIYYYNRHYIEDFFMEYLNTFSYKGETAEEGTTNLPLKFAERHLLTQDISVADKLNQDLVNLTPHVINIVGAQFYEK